MPLKNFNFEFWVPIRPNYFFYFPIVRSKIKIDVDQSVTYQKRRENVQKPSENTTFPKYGNFGWFSDVFSLLVSQIDLILFPLNFYCSPDFGFDCIKTTLKLEENQSFFNFGSRWVPPKSKCASLDIFLTHLDPKVKYNWGFHQLLTHICQN